MLRNLAFFAAGGVAFAAANLVFARVLSVEDYGLVTLLVALTTLGFALGPVGLDGIALRDARAAPPALVVAVAAAMGCLFAIVGATAYDVAPALCIALAAAVTAGATIFVASADLRHAHRFRGAMALSQSPNAVLLAAAIACAALRVVGAHLAFVLFAAGLALVAAAAIAVRRSAKTHAMPTRGVPWREALALGGASFATMLLVQLERVTLPYLLPVSDLALMGVLATFAGSLFRILQMGVGFSLVPKLRAALSTEERRRLVAHSAALAATIVVAGSLAIVALAPVVERWLLAGKYHLPLELLVAAIVSGGSKICDSFVKTIGDALASARELATINALGFAAVGIAVAGAYFGSRFGLTGLVYGVAAGWQFRAAAAFLLVSKYLRAPVGMPAPTTRFT